jgi:hypothetical protein
VAPCNLNVSQIRLKPSTNPFKPSLSSLSLSNSSPSHPSSPTPAFRLLVSLIITIQQCSARTVRVDTHTLMFMLMNYNGLIITELCFEIFKPRQFSQTTV